MARIQILELPSEQIGDTYRTPFAIVIDQVESESLQTSTGVTFRTLTELTQREADSIARSVGAVGAVLAACTLEVG